MRYKSVASLEKRTSHMINNIGLALVCMILINEDGSRIECKSATRGVVLTNGQPWGAPSPSPSPSGISGNQNSRTGEEGAAAGYEFGWGASPGAEDPSKHNGETISPALIAIVAFLGSAFLIASYYKIAMKYCRSRHWSSNIITRSLRGFDSREQQLEDSDAALQDDSEGWQIFAHSRGLDEALIKSIPVRTYARGDPLVEGTAECAVCLVEFLENEALRILPKCGHGFHVNCVDAWLRSHASCPLCRANVVNSDSPFVPAMAFRIRPSLENGMALVVHDSFMAQTDNNLSSGTQSGSAEDERAINVDGLVAKKTPDAAEISEANVSPLTLTRSYSLGSCSGSEHFITGDDDPRDGGRIDLESPVESLLVHRRTTSWWSKTLSPFNPKSSVFSFSSRGLRSPFSRKGSSSSSAIHWSSIFAMAESRRACATRLRGGSLSPPFCRMGRAESVGSHRIQAMTSPVFVKRSFSVFTPSRLRTGDPEALLSPPRFNQRRRRNQLQL